MNRDESLGVIFKMVREHLKLFPQDQGRIIEASVGGMMDAISAANEMVSQAQLALAIMAHVENSKRVSSGSKDSLSYALVQLVKNLDDYPAIREYISKTEKEKRDDRLATD